MDREKVIENLTHLKERLKWQKDIQGYGIYIDYINGTIALLKEQEAKTGKWIQADEDTNVWECSECGALQIIIDGTPLDNSWFFCPHCGVRLEG